VLFSRPAPILSWVTLSTPIKRVGTCSVYPAVYNEDDTPEPHYPHSALRC
jgi:hypothetical protein